MAERIGEEITRSTTMSSMIYEAATTHIASDIVDDSSLRFILVPLAVLFSVLFLSALVLLMAKNRRRLMQIYRNRQHASNFSYLDDDSDTTPLVIGDDIDDDPTECLLKGKLQINSNKNNTHRYDTTTTTHSSKFT